MAAPVLDKETFCLLVQANQAALYRTARSILKNDQDAEDAVQEAICSAYAHRHALRELPSARAWLLRITANQCYALCRKRRDVVELAQVEDFLATPEKDHAETLSLWDAILQLPPDLRSVVTLFYYEDLPICQISQILQVSQGAIKTRLSRARARLKQLLAEE